MIPMRLWSIHPKYLDSIGLIACWREALLAKNVLENKTKGYREHPQLIRFKILKNPLNTINVYLAYILQEAENRKYNFDKSKVNLNMKTSRIITVTNKQLECEFAHLLRKLKERSPEDYKKLKDIKNIECNPLFTITQGPIEKWEKLKLK
jgi:hypothetical protein